jgi:hypothetical protein
MRGVSKLLATEQDILNNIGIDKAETRILLEQLLEGRFVWSKQGDLADGDTGATDDTHKVVEEVLDSMDYMNPDAEKKLVQYVYQEDVNAPIFKMGLTVQKVEEYIAMCAA